MTFTVRMGMPEMDALWKRLAEGARDGTLKGDDKLLAKKFAKAVRLLAENPQHPGLRSHEIDALTKRFKAKVFQSYLENNTPAAGRLFWVYGPGPKEITVLGLEPHPEDAKNNAYQRVLLSNLPAPAPAESAPHAPQEGPAPASPRRPKGKKR